MKTYEMPNGDIQLGDFPYRKSRDWLNIVWAVTRQCNLGCPYCIGAASKGKARSLLDNYSPQTIANAFVDLRDRSGKQLYLCMTGGEPTLVERYIDLCVLLAHANITIELQSNLLSKHSLDFMQQVPTDSIAQITTAYHSWKLDVDAPSRERFFKHVSYAAEHNIPLIVKLIALPTEIQHLERSYIKLRAKLPHNVILLVVPFVQGTIYPYSYTQEEGVLLDRLAEGRREEQRAHRLGGGKFKGMHCDAGCGFLTLTEDGTAIRCVSDEKREVLGKLVDHTIKLLAGPTSCPHSFCGCAPRGLYFGVNPWDYIAGVEEEDAYYCRYGPKI